MEAGSAQDRRKPGFLSIYGDSFQGRLIAAPSQFQLVIFPVRRFRPLDPTLLCTASARAVKKVAILGDMTASRWIVIAPASAALRRILVARMLSTPATDLNTFL